MQISIEVDNQLLSDLVTEELQNLDKEKIRDIATEALSSYFSTYEGIKELLYKPSVYYDRPSEIRPEIWKLLSDSFCPADIKKVQDVLAKYMIEHCRDVVVDTMSKVFTGMLLNDDLKREMAYLLSRDNR